MSSALYAVLGRPIAHSLSPVLHAAAFCAEGRDAVYEAQDVGVDELPAALASLAARGAFGANLTAPLKEIALPLCASLTARARKAGAVNTLRFEPGGLSGDNTDGDGLATFLEQHGVALKGARVVFLGGGGAVRGIAPAFAARGALEMTAVVRSERAPIAGVKFALTEDALDGADVVVRALPAAAGALFAERVSPAAVAVDLLYHPATTPWLAAVRARGVRAANGLGMLIEQARLAQEFWHGTKPPRSALEEAVGWSDPFAA